MNRQGLGPEAKNKDSVKLDTDFDINSENGLTNKRLTEFRNSIAPAPNYSQPSANLSSNHTGVYEVGTNLAMQLGVSFTKRDAGNATNFVLNKNGTQIHQDTAAFTHNDNIVLGRETINYRAAVSYEDGAIKNNPDFDFPDDRGQILAGTKQSPVRSITGKLKIFFGAASSIPNTSAGVRSLSNVYEGVNNINLNTGTTNKKFIVAIPSLLTSAASLNALDTTNNVSYIYNLADVFNVNLPTGFQEYRIYALEIGNAYPSEANHRITL